MSTSQEGRPHLVRRRIRLDREVGLVPHRGRGRDVDQPHRRRSPGRSRLEHEDLVHRLRRLRCRPDRGHRPRQEVAGDQVRRASRRPLVPARRVRHATTSTSSSHHLQVARRLAARPGAGAQRRLRHPQAGVRSRLRRGRRRRGQLPRVLPAAARRRHRAEVAITFAEETGKGFYDQIEDAVDAHDEAPFFDFAHMPADWTVPAPSPKGQLIRS